MERSEPDTQTVFRGGGEPSVLEVVRDGETCDALPLARQQVTPTASKGSNGRVEQAKKAVEGMTRTILSCVNSGTRWKHRLVTQWCNGRSDTLRGCWSVFQLGEDGLTRYYRQHQRNYQSADSPFAQVVLWRDPGPHTPQTSIQVGLRSMVGAVSSQ